MRDTADLLLRLAEPGTPAPDMSSCGQDRLPLLKGLAEQHRVGPWLSHRLDGSGTEAAPLECWTRQRHAGKLRALSMHRDYRSIQEGFLSAGVSALPLKGIDLAFRIYPDPGLRPFEDVDILVPPEQIDAAGAALVEQGYQVPQTLLPSSWIRKFHFHLPFVHPDTRTFVELHWALADRRVLPPQATEAAVQESLSQGHLPHDLYACYLLAHLGKHGCLNARVARHPDRILALHPYADLRLIWFVDLCLLLDRTSLSPDAVLDRAGSLGMLPTVRTGLNLLQRLFPSMALEIATPEPGREGWIEGIIKNRLLQAMEQSCSQHAPAPAQLPWILRTNPRLHVRPIRAFSHGH